MKLNFPLTLIAAVAIAGGALAQNISPAVSAQINAVQAEKAARSPEQRKLDSQLLYLSRETVGQRAVAGAPDLKSRVEREVDGSVIVDISAQPGMELAKAITDAGGTVIYESPRWNSVRASLPPAALIGIAARADVKSIQQGAKAITHTGLVVNEADAAHKAGLSRINYGVNGSGIKVGVLSDSAKNYINSVANGELPFFTVLPGRSGDLNSGGEGTAMSEIVADIAPGAQIYFASALDGKAFFADSILALRTNGCQIIVDDVSYSDEWQFQDDMIGQAINTVVSNGAVYLSSSGNEGSLKRGNSTTWEGDFVDGGTNPPLPTGRVHSFGSQNYNRLSTSDSDVSLQWSDEYHSSTNNYDLYILNAAGTSIVTASTGVQTGTQAPYESVSQVHPGERIVIWKANDAAVRYLRLSCTGSPIEIQTAGQTIGHAATANCICVAASDASAAVASAPFTFTTNSPTENSSSDGPHKMFYYPNGTPITPVNFLATGGVTIQSPAITGGDGGATSVPGFEHFFGTSAAAPATAAIAALVWSKRPALTGAQIRTNLETSCLDIEGPGFDVNSGNGILMADLALAQPASPSGNPPVAVNDTLGAVKNQTVSLPAAKLAANDTDPNGDPLTVTVVFSPSVQGGTVALASGTVTYTPPTNYTGSDSFFYTITDGNGNAATAVVNVTVDPSTAVSPNVVYGPVVTNGTFVVRFAGTPGYTYTIEFSASLTGPWVQKLPNLTAPTNNAAGYGVGVFQFSEPSGTAGFYRTVYPAY